MTRVRVDLRVATQDGTYIPAVGRTKWTPTRRRHVDGSTDYTVLPSGFSVWLMSAAPIVEVAPTSAGWCWKVQEYTQAGGVRYVGVPDSATVVDYGDLPDVDPTSLSGASVPEASWWLALEQKADKGTVVAAPTGDSMYVLSWSPTTGWPARPAGTLIAAGRVSYRAVVAGGATAPLPTDMLDGDELVRRSA